MCEISVEKYGSILDFVLDHLKSQEICEKAIKNGSRALEFVTNWFVTQEQLKLRHDYDQY